MITNRQRANPYADPTGYTRVDNTIFDQVMPTLSGNGLKVLLIALRQTWGWHDPQSPTGRKQCDAISYSQFMEKGGMARATVKRAIQECLDAGYLVRKQRGQGYVYAVNAASVLAGSETEPATGSDIEPTTGSKTEHTKGKENEKIDGDAASILARLQSFGMTLDPEVCALAARYALPQVEHAIERARQQARRNCPGLLRCWMRSGHMPFPPTKERTHAPYNRDHQGLNDDARAFAAYRAARKADRAARKTDRAARKTDRAA